MSEPTSTFPRIPNPLLYQISTRPWLYSLFQKYGRPFSSLAQVPDEELDAIQHSGFNIVWLTGIWKLGTVGLTFDRTQPQKRAYYDTVLPSWTEDDVIGSPFAIAEYVINPELGTTDDLRQFRRRLHQRGIGLFVDFVGNHSAIDSPLLKAHPEFYIRAAPTDMLPFDDQWYLPNGVAYGRDPYSGAWKDTAQFNIWIPGMKEELIRILDVCASVADGVRCDMAMLLINDVVEQTWGFQQRCRGITQPKTEFWVDAIKHVKATYPDFLFLGEVYWGREWQLLSFGFDYMYDKDGLYNRLRDGHLDNLRSYISSTELAKLAHFTENHDEDRAIAVFGSVERSEAAAVVSFTLPGMRFLFQGQTSGFEKKLAVHLRRASPEEEKPEVQRFYCALLDSLKDPVFHQGVWSVVTPMAVDETSWRFLCWKWVRGRDRRLVVVNYSDCKAYCRVKFCDLCIDTTSPEEVCDPSSPSLADSAPQKKQVITFVDELTGITYPRELDDLQANGLFIILDSWHSHIFRYSPL